MNVPLSLVLALSSLSSILANVMVQDGDYKFPLNDVKQLWDLINHLAEGVSDKDSTISTPLCSSTGLPQVFQPVCDSKDADHVFLRLERIAVRSDECEICVHPACTGC
ncbi:guanylin-like isoform X2 [Narcine bancroftii]|uniref:guanylin-like isoform X2 n=1 Tax=Narcine bancroftii TaxID=1343680 RepID=UPI0038322A79